MLTGLSVRTQSVTGSLSFGSPQRLVRRCLWLGALYRRWIENADVPLCRHLVSAVGRSASYKLEMYLFVLLCRHLLSLDPTVCRNTSHEVEMYFLPPCFRLILTICNCFYRFFRERDIASGRSPDRDKADPFHAPTRSAKLYDFALDIQDAMELRALGPHAKLVKVISIWNSRGSRMMTLNYLAPCGLHEFLLHVVGEVELLFMMTGELDYIRRVWLRASFAFLTRYQQDLKRTWTVCKVRAGYTQSENCTIGGNYIQTDFGQHIAFCHLELACVWCILLKGTTRDYYDHVRRMQEVPLSVGLARSAKFFPVWTITSIITLFFSRVASPLDHRCWLISQTGSQYEAVVSVEVFAVELPANVPSLLRGVNSIRGQNPLGLCLDVWPSGFYCLPDPPASE